MYSVTSIQPEIVKALCSRSEHGMEDEDSVAHVTCMSQTALTFDLNLVDDVKQDTTYNWWEL